MSPADCVQAEQGFTAGDLIDPFGALGGRARVELRFEFLVFGKQRFERCHVLFAELPI